MCRIRHRDHTLFISLMHVDINSIYIIGNDLAVDYNEKRRLETSLRTNRVSSAKDDVRDGALHVPEEVLIGNLASQSLI